MEYKQLEQDEIDKGIASAMHGREVEHHSHELNVKVYTEMLRKIEDDRAADPENYVDPPMGNPDWVWSTYVDRMRREAIMEMQKIDGIHRALAANFEGDEKRLNKAVKAAKKQRENDAKKARR
jgi:hypothetical protein